MLIATPLSATQELKPGQPVVHIDHCIGRYIGLQTLEAGGMKTEYSIEYQKRTPSFRVRTRCVFEPLLTLPGGAEESAPLHKLGGEAAKSA